MTVLVCKCKETKMMFSHAIDKKGVSDEYGTKCLIDDLSTLGRKKVILKCDGEPAIKDLQREVKKCREEETLTENSPKTSSQSNGIAERAVQAFEEQFRTMKGALEKRLCATVPIEHPVILWMMSYVTDLLNRYHVGKDGKTAYERLIGKSYKREIVEFGEKVFYKI